MSYSGNWDVNKYKEEHESDDQWQLRKTFLMKWKDHYPEERLVCLARVFTNIEFMGCRYPNEVMHEVARLSADVAKQYRSNKKTKLQRTFVSASDAAEDRARGVKREGGIIVERTTNKTARIAFIPQGQNDSNENNEEDDKSCVDRLLQRMNQTQSQDKMETELKKPVLHNNSNENPTNDINVNGVPDFRGINYIEDMLNIRCLDPRDFDERMFNTAFGQFVLVIRPWNDMINNLISTCAILKIPFTQEHKNGVFTVTMNKQVLASIAGEKALVRRRACKLIWENLRHSSVILVLKEQWVSQNDSRISMNDMADKKHEFGEPIEDSVALKMMKLMGWKGGGLGADSQGIAEPIKPNLRMVRRAGLGHEASSGLEQLKRAGLALMRRRGVVVDADLVFAADFSPEERAVLHKCANQCGLMSRSYGKGADRFLVVTNKLRPLSLVRAVLECGGETPKYRVFIPASIGDPGAWTTSYKQDRR